jgi:ribose 5-phosphate isomerase B
MRVVIDSDCNGHDLKKTLVDSLRRAGHEVVDLDYSTAHPDSNYPDVALNLGRKIQSGEFSKGVLICGTGLVMAITANKLKGVYAGACEGIFAAERLAKSNNAQIITLGAQVTGPETAKIIVNAFIEAEFQGGRSLPKVTRIQDIENEIFRQSNGALNDTIRDIGGRTA